jgi:hypothetical protein
MFYKLFQQTSFRKHQRVKKQEAAREAEDLKQYTSYIANEANRQAPSQAHSQVKGREPDGLRQAVCQPE